MLWIKSTTKCHNRRNVVKRITAINKIHTKLQDNQFCSRSNPADSPLTSNNLIDYLYSTTLSGDRFHQNN